ncbi:MAG: ABC transporter permease [Planctomycetota bacterium]
MRRLRIHWPRLRVLFGKEILDLARDKKVVVAALLLPTILFPSLLFLSQALFSRAKSSPDEGPIRVGISGTSPFLDRLVRSIRGASWATNCAREDIADGSLDAILRYERAAEGAPVLTLLYDSGRGSSRVAAARLEDNLKRVAREIRSTMLQDAGIDTVSLPARNIVHVDTAPVGSGANRHYARLLPMLLVLVLVAAVSFAAIDLFPGERERGTLETLLVQPLRTGEVVTAKFLAIFAVSTAAIFANLTGLWAMSLAESEVGGTRSMSPGMLGVLFLLSLPLCLLISACLVRVVARAQTVREGQHYLLPLTMFCLLPPFLAGSPHVPFDMFTAILPIAGAALAFREASLGNVPLLPVAMMLLSTTVYSLGAQRSTCPPVKGSSSTSTGKEAPVEPC